MNEGSAQRSPGAGSRLTRQGRLWTGLALLVALTAFVSTDRRFSILEDETEAVHASRAPVVEIVRPFLFGEGVHQHPPLPEILFHGWLAFGGVSQWSLRLPSVACYLLGLLILALAARRLAGAAAYSATLWAGLFWPFGFHFGRLVGWYSLCFLLVAALTLAYLRYLERPNIGRLAAFGGVALCLVYSNYFGWVILGCLCVDAIIAGHGKRFAIAAGALLVAYMPTWRAFLAQVSEASDPQGGLPLLSKLLNGGYNIYSIFLSESIAPWYWWFSVPAALCIGVGVILAAMHPASRKWLAYFAVIFGGLAALGAVNTKRLLFISPWLLLAFALALAGLPTKRARLWLLVVSIVFAGMGWMGTVTRRYYAAAHFIEPWAEIADRAAASLGAGAFVASNSPSFMFDLQLSLARAGLRATFGRTRSGRGP